MNIFTCTSQNEVDLDDLHIFKIGFKIGFGDKFQKISCKISHRISCKIPCSISHKISCSISHRISHRFSCKNFPQDFPARISHKIFLQDFAELDPDWLVPHHPIPNAKFPPITALLNMPTYHKSAKVSPPPFPQILWEPQINEKADCKRASNKKKILN